MVKIGVIGAGHLGKIHIKLIKDIEGFDLIGFYDINSDVSKNVSAEFNIKAYNDVDELINNVDVVDIVTPTISHYFYAEKAIKASKHIFIEKPITTTIDEAESLLKLAHEGNIKVQVGHVERFNPAYTAALPYLKNPMFIETHRLALFNPRGTDVPVVLDLMIHDLDIVLHSVKSNIKKIHASGVAVVSDTPDIANARIEFDNGCVANLTSSRISMKNMRKSRFFQRDAYISIDFLEKKTEVLKMKSVEGKPDPLSMVIDLGNDKGKKEILFIQPEVVQSNAIQEELRSFLNAVINNSETSVGLEDGLAALSVAHQILEKVNLNLSNI
ncbi:MAG: Gfo/Idh/MocA family oxidoreductase [Marinilabiliales bacterium]